MTGADGYRADLVEAPMLPHPQISSSPYQGEGGWGLGSPDIPASQPPPLIPPRKGEGDDCTINL